ncbi:MAG: glycosyltransferase [Candidatus Kapabacteria bacterium]|jgi:glycosyltransferase involved in cell wall biosynthesis|nr:glycosyltransferase [Candidatus Kapabacteria bacterium]
MNINDYIKIAENLIDKGNFDAAAEIISECLKLDSFDVELIKLYARTLYKLGRLHNSLYLLEEVERYKQDRDSTLLKEQIQSVMNEKGIKEKLISVAYIVKNEEKTLADSIKSISSIADEIIVVDTGSSDGTVRIAEQAGCKVFRFDWINDYSAARNESIKYAESRWILYLDADEELEHESASIIRNIAEDADRNTGGFVCEIINQYIDDYGKLSNYSGLYPRFFRNLTYPLVNFFGKIHEQISPSFMQRDYKMKESNLKILHHGYVTSKTEMDKKVRGHLKTLTEHVEQEPHNAYSWYQLGNTLFQMKKYKEAVPILENALKCKNLTPFLSANTALAISKCEEANDDLKSAFSWTHKALQYIDKYDQALIRKAEILDKLGQLDKFIKK